MRLAVLVLAALVARPALAQADPRPAVPVDTLGFGLTDAATASLLTMAPGREVYSLFGHSALRIADPAAGVDRTYNYGTFDFAQPGFVVRFARGRLDYMLAAAPTADEVARYRALGRDVIEQTLALDAPTVRTLYDALETNALPENREYRYNFLFDNCSTRLLGILDTALVRAGHAPAALAPAADGRTFRQRLAPYLVGTPLVEVGVDLALGVPVDRAPTAREATFLPYDLMDAFDRATVDGRPLVARRDTVLRTGFPAMPARTPRWPLVASVVVLAAAVALALARRLVGAVRAFDAVLFGVAGVAGLVLLFLALATEHAVTRPNVNLLWAWPTHLAAAVALARRGTPAPALRLYLVVAAAAGVVSAALAVVDVPQVLPAAVVPLAMAVAVRAATRTRPS